MNTIKVLTDFIGMCSSIEEAAQRLGVEKEKLDSWIIAGEAMVKNIVTDVANFDLYGVNGVIAKPQLYPYFSVVCDDEQLFFFYVHGSSCIYSTSIEGGASITKNGIDIFLTHEYTCVRGLNDKGERIHVYSEPGDLSKAIKKFKKMKAY